MKKGTTGIMQVNLTTLRYHGLWPMYLNGEKDRFFRLKSLLIFSTIFIVWYGSTSHMINIIIGNTNV